MTSNPQPVTRRCSNCRFIRVSKRQYTCPKCGGHMLTVAADEVIDLTSQAARIRQALTPGDYLAAVKAG